MHRYQIYPDAPAAAEAVADYLQQRIENVLQTSSNCHIALPGGSTPARCLELLAGKKLLWPKIHWYLTDERCLPEGDSDRNDTLIKNTLWSRSPVPEQNQHTIRAQLGAKQAAAEYERQLQALTQLDIVLLGMGEDGHTASLFPNNVALKDSRLVVPVFNAPKPPAERVSLGKTSLKTANHRVALVTGSSKAEALRGVRSGEALPINCIGDIEWFVDRFAAAA